MVIVLDRHLSVEAVGRSVCVEDAEALAQLMLDAYRGSVDDEGETLDGARGEIGRLFDGDYGDLLRECSFLVERGGTIVSASLVTMWKGTPLLAFSITDPRWKRRGLARTTLLHSMNALAERGHERLRLIVTRGNAPAEGLYESLGFEDESGRRNSNSSR